MKTILLSTLFALALGFSSNAQVFEDDFTSLDTTAVNSMFFDQSWTLYVLHTGGVFTFGQTDSQLEVTSEGSGEWDAVKYIFPTPISMTLSESIFLHAKLDPLSTDSVVYVAIGLGQSTTPSGNLEVNQWATEGAATLDTSWTTIKATVGSWEDTNADGGNPVGLIDNTTIEYMTFSMNRGFGSGMGAVWAPIQKTFEGKLLVDYIQIKTDTTLSINESTDLTKSFNVFPNPASDNVTLSYTLNEMSDVAVDIYNVTGQKVSTVFSGSQTSGTFYVPVNVEKLNSGLYYASFTVNNVKMGLKKLIIK